MLTSEVTRAAVEGRLSWTNATAWGAAPAGWGPAFAGDSAYCFDRRDMGVLSKAELRLAFEVRPSGGCFPLVIAASITVSIYVLFRHYRKNGWYPGVVTETELSPTVERVDVVIPAGSYPNATIAMSEVLELDSSAEGVRSVIAGWKSPNE